MGEMSSIAWTNSSWNPWTGCTKISPGCKNCYMYRDKARYGQDPTHVVRSHTTFHSPLRWKEPRLVFTCSWSDFFHEDADSWREDAWSIIEATPHHTYQILTKRPERIAPFLRGRAVPHHVWLGISAETQEYLENRSHWLQMIEADTLFWSCEPLLGKIDALGCFAYCPLHDFDSGFCVGPCVSKRKAVHWVIVGGESGPNRRPMKIEWLESIVDQCHAAGVPCFVKQDSALRPGQQGRIPNELWAMKQFPATIDAVGL